MVRRRSCVVSNHEATMPLILRDAAKTPLLRMRAAELPLYIVDPIRLDLRLEAVERGRGCRAVDGIFSLCQQRKHLQVDRGRMMDDVAIIAQIVGYLAGHTKIVQRDIRKLRQSRQRVGGKIINRLQSPAKRPSSPRIAGLNRAQSRCRTSRPDFSQSG